MSDPKDINTPSAASEEIKDDVKVEIEPRMIPPYAQNPDKNPSYASRNSKIFKAIREFADQLNDAFGKDDVNVNKVYRILEKTSITNRKVVMRHLVIFHTFLEKNRMAILARSVDDFQMDRIELTDRIGMNLRDIINKSDESTRKIIWQHFFNIMYVFDPEDAIVKNELKVAISENDTKENKFLMDTFSKFEDVMKTSSGEERKDPMQMMNGLMQSGFLNDMIGNINNGVSKGDLNIKGLISTVQNLLGNLSETIDREEKNEKQEK